MKKILPAILLFFLCNGCEEVHQIVLTEDEEVIVEFFNDVTLGFDYFEGSAVTRRWESPISIYVYGQPSNDLMLEFTQIISELELFTFGRLDISIVDSESQANFELYFMGAEEYGLEYSQLVPFLDENFGFFALDWNSENQINFATMYVDIERATELNDQVHLLREEFTQALGLGRSSDLHATSIFSTTGNAQSYSELDREIIRLLYHAEMSVGLNSSQTTEVLTDILFEER